MQGPEALVEPAIDWRIDWNIDEDIRRAETLPAEVYRDPRYFALARERVFARSWQWVAGTHGERVPGPAAARARGPGGARGWQWVGDPDAMRAPGQVLPVTLLEGVLDEPLLFTRSAEDEVRCLSNVCTHRGTLVCEAAGVLPALRC